MSIQTEIKKAKNLINLHKILKEQSVMLIENDEGSIALATIDSFIVIHSEEIGINKGYTGDFDADSESDFNCIGNWTPFNGSAEITNEIQF